LAFSALGSIFYFLSVLLCINRFAALGIPAPNRTVSLEPHAAQPTVDAVQGDLVSSPFSTFRPVSVNRIRLS
jgi:hypothetical protein